MKAIFLTFCFALFLTGLAAQEQYMKSVVRITAQIEGIGEETGAGIIVGKDGAKYYVATARHVVDGSADIAVQVHGDKAKYKASVLHQDEGMDAAVLVFTPGKALTLQELFPAEPGIITQGRKVQSIGHPGGGYWLANLLNLVQQSSLYEDERFFSITPQAIIGGCSGGPVFVETGAWLGMITETSAVQAKCLKAEALTKWLKAKKVLTRLVDFPAPEMVRMKGGESRVDTFFFDIFNTFYYKDGFANGTYCKELRKYTIKPFSIGKYEVTVREFEAFVTASGYETFAEKEGESIVMAKKRKDKFHLTTQKGVNWRHDEFGNLRPQDQYNFPVIHVTADDAEAYCKWLSKKTGSKYRLPTWKEWVYAFLPQNNSSVKKDAIFGNIRDETWNNIEIGNAHCLSVGYKDGFNQIAPAGSFAQNVWGVHDLYGNVSEWCQDKSNVISEDEDGEKVKMPCATYLGPNWLTWYTKYTGDCTWGPLENPQKQDDYLNAKEYEGLNIHFMGEREEGEGTGVPLSMDGLVEPYIPHSFPMIPICFIGFRVASD